MKIADYKDRIIVIYQHGKISKIFVPHAANVNMDGLKADDMIMLLDESPIIIDITDENRSD